MKKSKQQRRQSVDPSQFKLTEDDQYKAARENLLSKVVPDEEANALSKQAGNQQTHKSKSEQNMSVAKNLMRLFAHQKEAIEDLKQCRVNPDFTSAFRNDLEFFIPQLCSFFLKGNYEDPQELKDLIVLASSASFYFSHRVWFFFQSTMFQDRLKNVCLEINEKLYLANSQDLITLIGDLNLLDFYPNFKMDKSLIRYHHNNSNNTNQLQNEIEKDQQIDKIIQTQKIIKRYVNDGKDEEELNFDNNMMILKKTGTFLSVDDHGNEISICAKDIILQPFTLSLDNIVEESKIDNTSNMEPDQKFKLQAYLSTPKFIKCLTDVSHNLSALKIPKDEKVSILKEEIRKINSQLPASVYIPFVNELYRPEELSVYSNKNGQNNAFSSLSSNSQRSNKSQSFDENKDLENPYNKDKKKHKRQISAIDGQNPKNQSGSSQNKQDQRWKSSANKKNPNNKHSESREKDEEAQELVKLADMRVSNALVINRHQRRSFRRSPNEKTDQNALKINTVENLRKQQTINPLAQIRNHIMEESADMSFEEDEGIEMTQQQNLLNPSIQTSKVQIQGQGQQSIGNQPQNLGIVKKSYEPPQLATVLESEDHFFTTNLIKQTSIEKHQRIYKNQGPNFNNNAQYEIDPSDKVINLPDSDEDSSQSEGRDKIDSSGSDTSSDEDMIVARTEEEEEKQIAQLKKYEDLELGNAVEDVIRSMSRRQTKADCKNILIEETSQEQEERIRKNSPFGHLKTWKLFRMIVKSNDDVRQEQFAMQLISEIHQIFRIRKLPIFLKAYEILATGPRCGLIEVITDALSLDEIHKKTEGSSLYDFYLKNFGQGRKKSRAFRRAQKAFIQSLAGYSLACYILQIKDRHNQNIMIDSQGHIIHIDYGFLLSNQPGKGLKFEKAPFKLTQEFVEVMRGTKTKKFIAFRNLMKINDGNGIEGLTLLLRWRKYYQITKREIFPDWKEDE
ncbi:phosphatidylinositol kinase (pik-k) [Stylonychia lemnae]|uniref:Phosphatidylinositol kinase (Pik-k) n=1 Tax=Stylonychia lemnae TaxID=5949 RepID=A0A078B1F4_STYLE|nr:phosphatidylinositol kinase (pik-k) [Stylonychia lemnae]|eukprot:CDW87043.1 phosphatidylinositol kinase (pik-k) [Stylonychia lemnae]